MNPKGMYLIIFYAGVFILLACLFAFLPNMYAFILKVLLITIGVLVLILFATRAIIKKRVALLIYPLSLLIVFISAFLAGNYIYDRFQQRTIIYGNIIIKALDQYYQLNNKYPSNVKELTPDYLKEIEIKNKKFLYFGQEEQFELCIPSKEGVLRYKSTFRKWFSF